MTAGDRTGADFQAVLLYLKETRGFDFTGYKQTSLSRRLHRRMTQVGIESYPDYIDHLQVNTDEFAALFNTLLINVTGFLRDTDSWDFLRTEVVPKVLQEVGPEAPIRVWSAGCASGEEAYSLAILLTEALGVDAFRQRVKIYATDIDEEALAQARQASYGEREVEGLPPDLLERYFEQQGSRHIFRQDLRRSIIFGRNDLVQDAPISRIHLLLCRNTLMYFNAETQAKILTRLHFALLPQGVLFLGKAEMLLSYESLFKPVDLKRRIFRKVPTRGLAPGAMFSHASTPARRTAGDGDDELREQAFSAGPVAQIVVTADDQVLLVNHQAQSMFGLTSRDVGRPLRDLELSYRPVELRAQVDRVKAERRTLRLKDIEWLRGPAETVWLDVQLSPLVSEGTVLGVSIVFQDVSAARRLMDELEHANRQLESAYEELQSTNEELETTNEELQSTVEELETTNEELQSTNEELETMNEELQSTNDELQTINERLSERSVELDDLNNFLESILTSLRSGVIVVDVEMRVIVWNRGSEELWGLRRDEANGQHLLNLDIGLPLSELRPLVRSALVDADPAGEVTIAAVNRRGRAVSVRVVASPLRSRGGDTEGAILVLEEN
ncbi:CheR family methyltransferase [Kutzneria sp. 744]|uniref:CheR family methyltransferase n=1 Tax=Kutzneria sp. (strain 744) TaxID=345341 RepID=UPI0005BA61A8|nr:CheR family methyltransferase [Kutzneria sp. 744]